MILCRDCLRPHAIGYDAFTSEPLSERALPICECPEPRWAEAGFDPVRGRLILVAQVVSIEAPEAEPEPGQLEIAVAA